MAKGVPKKYKAYFCNQWQGYWFFEALNDARAWETVRKYIKDHTSVVLVDIKAIFEVNDAKDHIRELPIYEKCSRIIEKSDFNEEGDTVIDISKAFYKAYFSNGECSGPYLAEIADNDEPALEAAGQHLKYHAESGKWDISKVKIIQVEELNEDKCFTINLMRKTQKKNRFLLKKTEL